MGNEERSELDVEVSTNTKLLNVHKFIHRELRREKQVLSSILNASDSNGCADTLKVVEDNLKACIDTWTCYLVTCEPLLQQHMYLSQCEIGELPRWQEENRRNEHINIMIAYLKQVEQWFSITHHYTKDIAVSNSHRCYGCGSDKFDMTETGSYCLGCGLTMRENQVVATEELKIKPLTPEDDATFKGIYKRALGEAPPLPVNMTESLDKWFLAEGYKASADVRANNLALTGPYVLKTLIDAMQSTNNSSYYRFLPAVLKHYWGVAPPALAHLQDICLEWYHTTCTLWLHCKVAGRKAKPNTAYHMFRLWEHAYLIGKTTIFVPHTLFKIPTSEEVIKTHERVFKQIFLRLGWDFRPLPIQKSQSETRRKDRKKRS